MDDRLGSAMSETAMIQQMMLQQQLMNPMLGLGSLGLPKDAAALAAFNPLMGLLTPSMALAQLQSLLALDPTISSSPSSAKPRTSSSGRLNAVVDKLTSANQSTPSSS
jgi:hypothetical protein